MWSDEPRLFRMSNGARLTLPATTTAERAAVVESEYRQILDAGASELRWPFLLERLAFWLVPLLVAGCALGVFSGYPTFQRRIRAAFSKVRENSTTGMPV